MIFRELKQYESEYIKSVRNDIINFLEHEVYGGKIEFRLGIPMGEVIDFIIELGGEYLDGEGDSNGWVNDTWEYFIFDGNEYCIYVCGWYGGLRIYPSERDI
jgi:hypothetical protein